MAGAIKSRLAAQLLLDKLGMPGTIAIGLFAFCLAFYVSTIRPGLEQIEDIQRQTQDTNGQPSKEIAVATADTALEQRLTKFYDAFPPEEEAARLLMSLFTAAERSGIVIAQGEYKIAEDKGGELSRYQVNLPITGNYVQARNFISMVLKTIPSASLDDFSIERGSAMDGNIAAHIRFTLFFSGGGR